MVLILESVKFYSWSVLSLRTLEHIDQSNLQIVDCYWDITDMDRSYIYIRNRT